MAGRAFSISTVIGALDRATGPARRVARSVGGTLTRAFGRAARGAGRASRAAGRFAIQTAKVATAAGTVAGGAVLGLAHRTAMAGDQMAKTARKAGISLRTYQELAHAAKRSGAEQETLNDGLKDFGIKLGELRMGTGGFHGFLKESSPLLLEQFKATKTTEEALELYLAVLGRIEDPAKRAAFANQAMGEAGVKTALIMENGAEGLAAMRQEAHDLGKVMSDDTAQAAEEYADGITRLKGVVGGLATQLGAKLLPALVKGLERFKDWWALNKEWIKLGLAKVFRTVATAVKAVPWGAIVGGIKRMVAAIRPFATRLVQLIRDNWGAISGFFKRLWDGVVTVFSLASSAALKILNTLAATLGPIWDGITATFTAFANFVTGVFSGDMDLVVGSLKALWGGLSGFFKGMWDLVKGVFQAAAGFFKGIWDRFAPDPLKRAWTAVSGFFKRLWDGIKRTFKAAIDIIKGWIDSLVGPVKWVFEKAGQLKDTVSGGISSVTSGVSNLAGRVQVAMGGGQSLDVSAMTAAINQATQAARANVGAGAGSTMARHLAGAQAMRSDVVVTLRGPGAEGAKVEKTKTTGAGAVTVNTGRRAAGAGRP